jgi:23S rRNA pseudouridine1911/1915/1917 synthase
MKTTQIKLTQTIPLHCFGMRLDQTLAELFSDYSRASLQKWLKQGDILVDGNLLRAKDKVNGGELIVLNVEVEDVTTDEPQDIELNILYEDADLLVLNKPAGLVVHPGAGNPDGTLLNALLNHVPALSQLPRAGIVHRLDKDTTGVMVVAKTMAAQTWLVGQLQERKVKREYEAIVVGDLIAGRTIDKPMSRHPKQRTKMAIAPEGYGKPAISHVNVLQRYGTYTRVRVRIETGRTHQIRVHLSHIGYPVLGDPLYGARLILPKGASEELIDELRAFKRQALHAYQLTLEHPTTHEVMSWKAKLPVDMSHLCRLFEINNGLKSQCDEDDFDDQIESIWVYR